jgi:hypothetical protein
MVAVALLMIALTGLTTLLTSSMSLERSNREMGLALEAAQSTIEQLRGEAFNEVFLRFNRDPSDDPALGASPGADFAVRGLNVRPNDADGMVGEIIFPGNGFVVREDFVDRDLGMPRDLTGDDPQWDNLDHDGTDVIVLPVRVRIEWRGRNGDQALQLVTTLGEN